MRPTEGSDGRDAFVEKVVEHRHRTVVDKLAILRGRQVKTDTYIVPATTEVARNLAATKFEGETLIETFQKAGAQISQGASCAACLGGPSDTFGRLNRSEVCISTTNRNFPGRMGSKTAQVYLASPYTVAASAITGTITDPREFL